MQERLDDIEHNHFYRALQKAIDLSKQAAPDNEGWVTQGPFTLKFVPTPSTPEDEADAGVQP